jgi:glycosyltransferase involved in cell wall biosynthesis
VVIPVFNRALAVADAIESVLAQTVAPAEIIVVDDGSKDGTRECLAPYMDRIKYIYQENKGVSAARNAGVRAARGEFIAFLDSDDVWHPRKLECQLRYLQEHPDTALIGAATFGVSAKGWQAISVEAPLRARPVALDDVVIRSPFPTSTVIVRKECMDAVGHFDTGLRNAEDRDFYIRIASRYPMARLDAILVGWGGRGGEHLSMGSYAAEESTRKMIHGVFERIESLRGRFWLKQRALSQAAFEASYMYLAKGNRLRALHRVLRSLILWPLVHSGCEKSRFPRVKRLIRLLFDLCTRKLEKPGSGGVSSPPLGRVLSASLSGPRANVAILEKHQHRQIGGHPVAGLEKNAGITFQGCTDDVTEPFFDGGTSPDSCSSPVREMREPTWFYRMQSTLTVECRERIGDLWRMAKRLFRIRYCFGLRSYLVARAEVRRAVRRGAVWCNESPSPASVPPSEISSTLTTGTGDRVLAEIDQDGYAFAVDPADAPIFNRRSRKVRRTLYRLDIVLRGGTVCFRKQFRPIPLRLGLSRWFWGWLGMPFYNSVAAYLRLQGLSFVPNIKEIDFGSRSIYMDWVFGENLKQHISHSGAAIFELDLAADPQLSGLSEVEKQTRQSRLFAETYGHIFDAEIEQMVRAMLEHGVAPIDVKPGNIVWGSRTGRLYWVDFESARLRSQPCWDDASHELLRRLSQSLGLRSKSAGEAGNRAKAADV